MHIIFVRRLSNVAFFIGGASGFIGNQLIHRGLSRLNLDLDDNYNSVQKIIVVVGKVILDKYGNPDDDVIRDSNITIGGGGPQAAFGASIGLAVRDMLTEGNEGNWRNNQMQNAQNANAPPLKQRIIFIAPIGLNNWTPEMTNGLNELLPMLECPPILCTSEDHFTPTIHIWHDENEIVKWLPVDGSFGKEGAGGLWRNRPSADDILDVIERYDEDGSDVALHSIIEAGHAPCNQGQDAQPFFNSTLMNRVSVASIEPIVFPNEARVVSQDDANGVRSLIERVQTSISDSFESNDKKLLLISPDRPCYDALTGISYNSMNDTKLVTEFAVRDGAKGSFVNDLTIHSATLETIDGKPINPTGAGNAYAGAYFACRASGSSAEEAACLANAVGAVMCEYEHMPPWTLDVLDRTAEAACEVRNRVFKDNTI